MRNAIVYHCFFALDCEVFKKNFPLEGVDKFLYSFIAIIALLILIPGSRRPHFGKLLLKEDTQKLELRSKIDEGETTGNEKTKKIIDLKGKKQFNYLECRTRMFI